MAEQHELAREVGGAGDDLLTVKEAAAVAGLSDSSWRDWVRAGKVPQGAWGRLGGAPTGQTCRVWKRSDVLAAVERTRTREAGTLTREEAMERLGVSDKKLAGWVKAGRVPGTRFGQGSSGKRMLLYPIDAIDRLKSELEAERVEAERQASPRPSPDETGVWLVPIFSNKHSGLVAKIDACDLLAVGGVRWNISTGGGKRAGDLSTASVIAPKVGSLARLILGLDGGDPRVVVHANGDGFDCRRCNLSITTLSAVSRKAERPDKYAHLPGPYCRLDEPGVVRLAVRTNRAGKGEAMIDADDFERVAGKRWHWSASRGNPDDGIVVEAVSGSPKPSLGRILLGISDPERLVQHRNGDRLDCRRGNLIEVSKAQVARRRSKPIPKSGQATSSRFKGVVRQKECRRWLATIAVNGERRVLGRFWSEVDAALAYDRAAREIDGEEAYQNLPDLAEAERLRALEPAPRLETGEWPPAGRIDRYEACAIFGIAITTLRTWEQEGRVTCGEIALKPGEVRKRIKLYPRAEIERLKAQFDREGQPYEDPNEPGVWRVPIRRLRSSEPCEAILDAQDVMVAHGRAWNWSERPEARVNGVVVLATASGRAMPLHRMMLGISDARTNVSVIDGDGLNLRRSNLRVGTQADVVRRSPPPKMIGGRAPTSRFKGVSKCPRDGRWIVQIGGRSEAGRKGRTIGRFADEREAARIYDDCTRAMWGDDAYVNFPELATNEPMLSYARRLVDGAVTRQRKRKFRRLRMEKQLRRQAREARRQARMRSLGKIDPWAGTDAWVHDDSVAKVTKADLMKLFNVGKATIQRWERSRWLTCGQMKGSVKVYPYEAIKPLLKVCRRVREPVADPDRANVWRVPLYGKGMRRKEVLVDTSTLKLIEGARCTVTFIGDRGHVSAWFPSDGRHVPLRRLIMGVDATDGREVNVQHRNGDPLDCTRANLVVRTSQQRSQTSRPIVAVRGVRTTSLYKGVCWSKAAKKWTATISTEGRSKYLGLFEREQDAALAYDRAARRLFGSHAYQNFPRETTFRKLSQAA